MFLTLVVQPDYDTRTKKKSKLREISGGTASEACVCVCVLELAQFPED